jgi:hypothetical protein
VSEDRAENLTKSASGATGEPQPPAPNQGKEEPIAATPSESPQSLQVDDVPPAASTDAATTMPPGSSGGVPTPGDSKGVSVPAVQAAAGTSEESEEIGDVRLIANAPPGKPDGEVDTRA